MWLIFLDESGYTSGDWKNGMGQQPFYAVSAVCFPAEKLSSIYGGLRKTIGDLKLAEQPSPLGQGFEIKASEIASGAGWWKAHDKERNSVREAMLRSPAEYGGSSIVVVIDKVAHAAKYAFPDDPFLLGFRYAFERIANFLESQKDDGYCIYDQNTRLQDPVLAQSSALIQKGSSIAGYSGFYEQDYQFVLKLERIVEMAVGDSKHSLGLQVADYFATFAYQYFRGGKPANCGWWNTLEKSLRKVNGEVNGFGLKVFP